MMRIVDSEVCGEGLPRNERSPAEAGVLSGFSSCFRLAAAIEARRLLFGFFDDFGFVVFFDDGRLGGFVARLFVAAEAEREDESPETDDRVDNAEGDETGVDRVAPAGFGRVVRNGGSDATNSGDGSANQELFQSLFATSNFIFIITHGSIIAYLSRERK